MPTGSEEHWEERAFTEAVRLLTANSSLTREQAEHELTSAYRASTIQPRRKALSTCVDELLAAHPKTPEPPEPLLQRIRNAFSRAGGAD